MELLFDQALRGLPPAVSAQPFAILGLLAFIYLGLAWIRLRSLVHAAPMPAPKPLSPEQPSAAFGIGGAMFAEFRRVLGDQGAFGMIVLAPVIYGLFYPQPYLGQLLRNIPLAVVDQDRTEVSHALVEALNADEALKVTIAADTLAEAQAALARREVFAIVGIPKHTEREILKGNKARLAAYVDSAYFLLYNRVSEGINEAANAVTAAVAAHGSLGHATLTRYSPVELLTEPLFNPTGGYASYVVPAAFMLILQQTLLMGTAMLGGVTFEAGGIEARRRRGGAMAVAGQALAHLCLAMPGVALYLIVLPRVYGFSTLGHVLDLFLLAVPFLLSVSLLGQFVGSWFTRRENAVLLFIATSLPLFFLVGVSWPLEAIPGELRAASHVFPSTTAIDGLVRINQMGASLFEVRHDWMTLWALTGIYGFLAILAAKIASWKENHLGH